MSPPKPFPKTHIALAHDWLVGMRGGEWVLDRLAKLFGPTDLYTLVRNGSPMSGAIDACNIITSRLQHFPRAAGAWRRAYLPLMPWAVERISVRPCDALISTSSAVMKSIIPPEGVPHICYCHSPARYIWEQGDDYAIGSGGAIRKVGLNLLRKRFQNWDRRTASRVTQFVANSQHTAARINRCFNRDAEVVYPPIRTEFFTVDEKVDREQWLLVVSALEPYKRTEIVIEAANRARLLLKIAGSGTQYERLKAMAGPTVELLGRVSDVQLRDLYRRAKALVFPQIEDFGMIALEAQACGCPVIAFDGGGAKETVTPTTGVFMREQSCEALLDALVEFETGAITASDCRANAIRFSESHFDDAIIEIVRRFL